MHQINVITEEFVKETRTDGAVTSLTIKLNAYDGDNNMTTVTGDGSTYLVHDDSTWQYLGVEDEIYYDWDNCTAIATQTMTYTVPAEDQTSLTQSTSHPHNTSEQLEYQTKRKAWYDAWSITEDCQNAYTALYTAVEAL